MVNTFSGFVVFGGGIWGVSVFQVEKVVKASSRLRMMRYKTESAKILNEYFITLLA